MERERAEAAAREAKAVERAKTSAKDARAS